MEGTNNKSVPLDKLLESLDVTKLTPEVDTSQIVVKTRAGQGGI